MIGWAAWSKLKQVCALAVVLLGLKAVAFPVPPASAAEKQDKARLETALREILVGKTAETKITLGKPVSYVASVVNKRVTRMVCTDVQVDSGKITYVMPWHVVPVMPKEEVPKASLQDSAEPGAAMRVENVEVVKTRVRLFLSEAATGHQSLLRLWFPKGFASRLGPREVLQPLSGLLVFDGVLGELLAQSEDSRLFPNRVADAQRAHEVAGREPAARLATGVAYLTLLEEEIGRREAWAELTGTPPESDELQVTRQVLDQEVAVLAEQAHGPRLAELRQELEGVADEIALLQGAAAGEAASMESVDGWRTRIEAWRQIVEEYWTLRGPGRSELRHALELGEAEFSQVERGFLLEAETEATLAARAASEAIGEGPVTTVKALAGQKGNLQRFRELLEERRALLAKLEPLAPGEVLARLAADEARLPEFESLIAQSEEALRPAVLAQQYAAMRKRRGQLYDQYTLAFGGSGHRKAASTLMGYLDQMIANRREAASLGDSAAKAQVTELQRSRRQIQGESP